MSEPKRPLLQTPIQEPLLAAVKLGAAQNFTSISDYVRRALVSQLRADGIDPHDARQSSRPVAAAADRTGAMAAS
jgi:hypothetical protein